MGMGVVRGERETGRKDLVVTEREPMGMGGEESMAGLGLVGVVAGLGWAGLGSARRRWRGCVCVCVRGRVRDRGKMREF